MANITHGKDGWRLTRYDWDEETGWGTFVYSRTNLNGVKEREPVQRFQPCYPVHHKLLADAKAEVERARVASLAR